MNSVVSSKPASFSNTDESNTHEKGLFVSSGTSTSDAMKNLAIEDSDATTTSAVMYNAYRRA